MHDLELALSFANYQTTLNQQKTILRQQFQDQCILAYNGGLFFVTPEFISGLSFITASWIIDMNSNPIKVDTLKDFVELATKTYNDAVSIYGEAYSKLKTQRSVKSLVDL
jgi:hypothetical protein